jgi:formiminoglutamase
VTTPERYAPGDDGMWSGRDDGDEPEVRRWHQVVRCVDLRGEVGPFAAPTLALIGYASDEGVRENLGRPGACDGPAKLRERLGNLPAVAGVDIVDAGDISDARTVLDTQESLAWAVERIVRLGGTPLVLGGGHDQAYGHFLGVAQATRRAPACINFDAHLDLRPIPAGGPNSGTPYTQAMEWCRGIGAEFRYAVLGVQRAGNTRGLLERAEAAGVTMVDADGFALDMLDDVMDAVDAAVAGADICLSIDLDVFAAAFAPGVSAPSAMGIAPDAVFRRVLRGILATGRVRGVEIAELLPSKDIDDRTARLAAAIAFEVASSLGGADGESA